MALHIFGLTRLDGTGYTRTRRRPRRHSANSARGSDWRRIIFANRVAIATTSPLLSLPAIPAGVRSTASWSPHSLEPPGLRQLNTSSGDAGHRGSYRRPVRRQWRHAGPPRPLGSTRKNYYRDEARRGRACVGGDAVCDSWLRQRFGVHHTAPSDRRLRGPSRHRLGSAPHTSADRPAAAASSPSPSPNSSGCSRSRSSSQSCHGRRSARWQRRWRCNAGSWTTPPTSCGRV